ncbi:hypothetical protein FB45DRAFT_1055732 [Roridomyces roridus]|uniref:WD40 repeat-like protein n=1 Tax=Roridomyces roridus TaxID=1738132 RepID=A0AAD7C115_9AGAR|nr:hypothetical protein FB45DRAFT_1055732 [Roridomyces roridus]
MSSGYLFSVKTASGVQWNPGHRHGDKPNLYVKIYQDGEQIHRTQTVSRTIEPRWEGDLFTLSSTTTGAVISVKLLHDATLSMLGDPCLGTAQIRLDELLGLCPADGSGKELHLVGAEGAQKGQPTGVLYVGVERISQGQLKSMTEEAHTSITNLSVGSAEVLVKTGDLTADTSSLPGVEPLVSSLKTVLEKLDIIVKLGDQLSQIHPYASTAWKILTLVYEEGTDEKASQLVDTMVEVYSFVEDVDFLPAKIKPLENVIQLIVKQTVECAIFIREYVSHGFSGRLQRDTLSNTGQKIDGLSQALRELKASFDHSLAVQSVFFSAKTVNTVESLAQAEKLKSLNPLTMDASSRSECLAGTRQDIVSCVTEWLLTTSGNSNILWLYGPPGSGKSTISTTISEYFRDLHRLGAFLFFDRNSTAAGSSPGSIICTLAHQLAESDARIRAAVCDAIAADAACVTAPLLSRFRQLLLNPLLKVAGEDQDRGPTVIVLDALDECGDPTSRQALVSLIVNEFHNLPSAFRILITSRPDSDIASPFSQKSHIAPMSLDVTSDSTKADIVAYLRFNMQSICNNKHLDPDWPGDPAIETLAAYSGGLFIWVVTACKFIGGFDPREQLATILASGVADDLDELYTVALRSSGDWRNETFASTARAVLGAIVLSKRPLIDSALDELLGFPRGRAAQVLGYLRCVVQWNPGSSAKILHTSFADYITDPQRSGEKPWFCDAQAQSKTLALGCLRVLSSQLRFNICNIEDSHIPTWEISDYSYRVVNFISRELEYASFFWANHLWEAGGSDDEILVQLKEFIRDKFLYWLEVLCMKFKVSLAKSSLQFVDQTYIKADDPFRDFLRDAIRFLTVFNDPINRNPAHIYISALGFTPRKSLIRKQFESRFPSKLHFTGSSGDHWISLLNVLDGHFDWVSSVAFAPDGETIASGGAQDARVVIWFAGDRDRNILGGVKEIDAGGVNAVAFLPNGHGVVAGTGTPLLFAHLTAKTVAEAGPPIIEANYEIDLSGLGIELPETEPDKEPEPEVKGGFYLWDLKTGTLVTGRFGDGDIIAIAVSPDSQHIATGSYDGVVRLWCLDTYSLVHSFSGHTSWVLSVAISPDGQLLASSSSDGTLRVWDLETNSKFAGPIYGENGPIISVCFSPDSKYIAFAFQHGGGIRVWNCETAVIRTLTTDLALSIAISSDGTRIAGGGDRTVQIWDFDTGALVAGPFEGHTALVVSVAFSPDNRRLVTGSEDHSVRVWDAEIGTTQPSGQFPGHLSGVQCVSYSPDGQYIASTSLDKPVHVWDSTTGALIAGPISMVFGVLSLAFACEGEQIVCGSLGGKILTWNFKTGAVVKISDGYTDTTTSVAIVTFSPEADVILSGVGKALSIWDSNTGALLYMPNPRHTADIVCVSYSSSGRHIASGSMDSTVRVWNIKAPDGVTCNVLNHPDFVRSVVFSPDEGKRLATACDDDTGTLVGGPFFVHRDWVLSLAYSPDAKQLACGLDDGTIKLLDSESGAVLAGPFEGHVAQVSSVAFAPTGTQVVSGSWDSTIRVWNLHTESVPDGWELDPRFQDGWMLDSASSLIMWIPPWIRKTLLMPRNSLLMSSEGKTTLDLVHFVHGKDWQKCFDTSNLD